MRFTPLLPVLFLAVPLRADEVKIHAGIPYAEPKNERQMLDVYSPANGTNLPVVVWIHGGGWRRGDKADVHKKPQAFVDRGFVLVSISYRFVPNATVKEIAGDVAKAIRWTHDHAKDFGGDGNTIIVAGHSAGANWLPWFAPTTAISRPKNCRCRSSRRAYRWTATPTMCRFRSRPWRKNERPATG